MTRILLLAAGAVVLWPVWSSDVAAAGQCRVQLPYVAPASSGFDRTLVRVSSDVAHEVRVQVTGYDDTGRRFGPKPLSVAPRGVVTLTSATLEEGFPGFDGLGDGAGWWRLVLSAGQPFRAGTYYRTADRFMSELTAPVIAAQNPAGRYRSDVEFFNPGSNTEKVSLLRLANTADSAAEVTIAGRDDSGRAAPGGTVRLRLPAGAAVTLSARELESGAGRLTGRLGDGVGKWRLTVTADRPLLVMSLLHATQTGHLANLSTVASAELTRTPPSPGTAPDLVVAASSSPSRPLGPGENFSLHARVHNSGGAASAATTLRWYLSTDSTISTTDAAVGAGAITRLEAGGHMNAPLRRAAPFTRGTYHYGACVDPVCGESDTTNNCSPAVPVTVRTGPDLVVGYAEVEVDRGANLVRWAALVKNIGDVASNGWTTLRINAGGKTWDTDVLGSIPPTSPYNLPGDPPNSVCRDGLYAPFRLPARGGTGQICVGPVSGERNTANNCTGYTVQEGERLECDPEGVNPDNWTGR